MRSPSVKMGCGASLKVAAITQPTSRKELEEENKHFRVTRFRFKLPAEVLQGFGDVLKIVARKSEKRRRPQIAEPSEVSVDQLMSSQPSQAHSWRPDNPPPQNHRFSLPGPAVEPSEEKAVKTESLFAAAVPRTESAYSKKNSSVLEDKEAEPVEAVVKQQTIEAEVMHLEQRPSMFTRVEEQKEDVVSAMDQLAESDLLSPEAPRTLPEEEEDAPAVDLTAQRQAREARDRQAQEEAERLAQEKRLEAESVLEAQKTEIAKMEDAAQSILSKYQ